MPAAASGVRLRSRDLLKFGMLYMNDGKWKDKDILNTDWTEQSLSSAITRPSTKDKMQDMVSNFGHSRKQ